ncbi:D-methionine transport system substrate-binding protein [Tindallia magadiensis]|uniref:D-methionine transport system substrate-binding protein n=1 Tax=Tindallia magadiensis TaxID=69895 RepID=A0A1I3BU30_9FIRM|nr:MetQ/NlpA family ABC transporter substrate-binding protein [Tindallia magadiensis]SFH65762.1 D-methionine transport system substrate-binding protein [Tindallia magadiensis]
MKKVGIMLVVLLLMTLMAGCSGSSNEEVSVEDAATEESAVEKEPLNLVIACAETTQALVDAVVPVMEEKGYQMTYQMFDNNVNTMVATNDESVDGLFLVHKPFMENFNKANDADLVMLEPHVFAVGMGVFSERYESIEELPEGASIAIMNDAMNMDRGLRIFSDAGYLKLAEDVERVTLLDIEENPKGLNFIEMDQTQTVRSLQDMDAVVAFFSHMKNAGKDFDNYMIRDQSPENYPQGVIVKEKNADAQWAKDLVDAFRSEEIRAFADDYYGGLYEYID